VIQHNARGGALGAGQLSWVGENGPELFASGSSGTIIPNDKLGGGDTYVLNAYGENPHELLRMLESAAREKDR
jgi:hypothetical protein